MRLSFYGAAETVTGSKYLIEESQQKYLIDCGLFQGLKELRLRNWNPFPVDPKSIQGVLLTHAHIDHSGYLPLLVKKGFRGTIYASSATFELCKILLKDSGYLQEEDAKRANRYGYTKHQPAEPLYTQEDAEKALTLFKTVNFHQEYPLTEGLSFTFAFSGHILGSSFVTLKSRKSTLVFSGDVGRPQDPIMRPPERISFADYLVLESTYGNRLHPKANAEDELDEVINSTIAKGGTVVIPSFAVGRAQTLLYYLYELKKAGRIPKNLPIYLDSPMAIDASSLLCEYADEHRLAVNECPLVGQVAQYVHTVDESKLLNASTKPSVIISASGMVEGGRVLHHIKFHAPRSEDTILFAGFQAPGTRGDRILSGEKEVKIHGQMVPIRARIANLESLSSHADYEELLSWLKGFEKPPKEVFLTHGEPNAAENLKKMIETRLGWSVTIPHYMQVVDLY